MCYITETVRSLYPVYPLTLVRETRVRSDRITLELVPYRRVFVFKLLSTWCDNNNCARNYDRWQGRKFG